ncbi:MAG TPA: transposase [Sphingomicrobium sp.]|nr:transposase [Sphingomicrobium sp.]
MSTEQQERTRRRWSVSEKRAAVALTMEPGASVSEVAAAFEVAPSQLSAWRRQMSDDDLGAAEVAAFAKVEVSPAPEQATSGKMVVAFPSGVRMRIEGSVDPSVLAAVLEAAAR